MAIPKIARGSSGAVQFISHSGPVFGGPSNNDSRMSGNIATVPSDDPLGHNFVVYNVAGSMEEGTREWDTGEFEVVSFAAKLNLTFDPSSGVVTATATAEGNGDGSPYWYEFTAPGLGSNVQRSNTVQFTGGDSATVKISSDNLQETATASAQICTATLVSEEVEIKGQNVGTGAPRYGNFYQATVDFNTFGALMQTTFSSTDSDVTVGAPFRGSALARPNQWTVDIEVNFDFEEKQTRTINWQSGDGGQCVFGGALAFDVERGAAPVVCPAGTHDDGTGQCVPDTTDPTGPQPCAAGYTWNGAACVPDVPTEPTDLDLVFVVVLTDGQVCVRALIKAPDGATVAWERNGAPLPAVEPPLELGEHTWYKVTLTSGSNSLSRCIGMERK